MHDFKEGDTVYTRDGLSGPGRISSIIGDRIAATFGRGHEQGWMDAENFLHVQPLLHTANRHNGSYYLPVLVASVRTRKVCTRDFVKRMTYPPVFQDVAEWLLRHRWADRDDVLHYRGRWAVIGIDETPERTPEAVALWLMTAPSVC
jgi:hypothetical protein